MSKEIVTEIRQAIEETQRAKNLREEQEASIQRAKKLKEETEEQALMARNEARLRATGVVELFEEFSEVVALTSEVGNQVIIVWNPDKTEIAMKFDRRNPYTGAEPETIRTILSKSEKHLVAKILESGELMINEHVMKKGESLEHAVSDAMMEVYRK